MQRKTYIGGDVLVKRPEKTKLAKVLDRSKALVLFSGGQDSTVCLGWALEKYAKVYTIGFNYGQRHQSELVCRKRILAAIETFPSWEGGLGPDLVLDMPFIATLGDSALTGTMAITMGDHGLPNTFVPGRNLFFLTIAAAYAYQHNIAHIVGGMGEADYSGYPDCRNEALVAQTAALNLGMDTHFDVHTPLMWKDKQHIWQMAEDIGGTKFVDFVRRETHTCYLDDRTRLKSWGYGCGACPACVLRKRGFEQYVASTAV